jgi:hypothetical protein
MGSVCIGIDIGQKHDPTAIAVVEIEVRQGTGRAEDYHLVRHLERLPLGTSYPAVAQRVAAVLAQVRARSRQTVRCYIDATGVGQPVVDTLRAAGVKATPVYFTHGDRRTVQEDSSVSLGKAWLVSRLQVLLQSGRLLLPKTSEAEVLARELLDYEIRVDEKANDTYGAFKVGTHDDLVTAVGLAVQDKPAGPYLWTRESA